MRTLFARFLFVFGWIDFNIFYGDFDFGWWFTYVLLAATGLGAYMLAVYVPRYLEDKRAEIQEFLHGR